MKGVDEILFCSDDFHLNVGYGRGYYDVDFNNY
jgi:hypothetical protein